MQIQFIGATHGVTGSAHLLKACGKNILVDWGMRQGREEDISYDMPLPVNEIDAVLVTMPMLTTQVICHCWQRVVSKAKSGLHRPQLTCVILC